MPEFHGPDVSQYQGRPDWDAFAAAYPDILVVGVKLTQGGWWKDSSGDYNRDALRARIGQGWNPHRTIEHQPVIMWYHFGTGDDIEVQAQNFVGQIETLRPGELAMVDWEQVPEIGLPEFPVAHTCTLMHRIGMLLDRPCGGYYGYFYEDSQHPRYDAHPWWMPWYGVETAPPPPWPIFRSHIVHQYGLEHLVGITPGTSVDANHVTDYPALLTAAGITNQGGIPQEWHMKRLSIPTSEGQWYLTSDGDGQTVRCAISDLQMVEILKLGGAIDPDPEPTLITDPALIARFTAIPETTRSAFAFAMVQLAEDIVTKIVPAVNDHTDQSRPQIDVSALAQALAPLVPGGGDPTVVLSVLGEALLAASHRTT